MNPFFEYSKMVKNKGTDPITFGGIAAVIVIVLNVYFRWVDFFILASAISLIFLVIELYRNKASAILDLGVTYLGVFYIGLFSGSILGIRELYKFSDQLYEQGGFLIIALLFTILIFD